MALESLSQYLNLESTLIVLLIASVIFLITVSIIGVILSKMIKFSIVIFIILLALALILFKFIL